MRRECPVEVLCVSSPVPPRCGCTVSGQGSAIGAGLWPFVTCPGSPSRLGCQVPSMGVCPGVCVWFDSPGRMANAAPARPGVYLVSLCTREVHPWPPLVFTLGVLPGMWPRCGPPPPPHWPMNMPEVGGWEPREV